METPTISFKRSFALSNTRVFPNLTRGGGLSGPFYKKISWKNTANFAVYIIQYDTKLITPFQTLKHYAEMPPL